MRVDEFLERFDSGDVKRQRDGYWMVRCPAHADRNPSLSVAAGDDERIILKCQAGCPTSAVLDAMNLKMGDLFGDEKPEKTIDAEYDYTDEEGNVLFQVVRYWPKDFRQRRPTPGGGWDWKLGDTRRVPFHLPNVVRAAKAGGKVVVVEGEKDVLALEARGMIATCNPGGAGKWRPEYSEALRGAKVAVVADRDDTGRNHARQVGESLEGIAASVRLLEPPEAKDISDHLAAGNSLDTLIDLAAESSADVGGLVAPETNSPTSTSELPPQDGTAEKETIVAILSWPKAIGIAVERGLRSEHFYQPQHGRLFAAANRVMLEGHNVDPVTVWGALEKAGEARQFDRVAVEAMAKSTHPVAGENVAAYAELLIGKAERRAKLGGARKIIEGAKRDDEVEYRRLVQEGLEELAADPETATQPTTRDEIAMALHNYLESDTPAVYYPLPWPVLNRGLPGGLLPGQTSVWLGWTNHGKSAAIDQALQHWHERGAKCGLLATEMGLIERMSRVVQNQTGISALDFLKKDLTPDQQAQLARHIKPENIPYEFHDAQGWSYQRIAQLITLKRYDVIVIDPLNLISGFADQETMTEAARSLQAVARRAGSHIAIVCHLNRNRAPKGEKNTVPKPHWFDVRDSGMVANNADVVIGVYRDQDDDGEVMSTGEIWIDKVRVGYKEKTFVSLEPVRFRFNGITAEERAAVLDAPVDLPGLVGGPF